MTEPKGLLERLRENYYGQVFTVHMNDVNSIRVILHNMYKSEAEDLDSFAKRWDDIKMIIRREDKALIWAADLHSRQVGLQIRKDITKLWRNLKGQPHTIYDYDKDEQAMYNMVEDK